MRSIPLAFTLGLILALPGLAQLVPAQTNATPPGVPDRYLFLLDVSAPMQPRAAAVQKAVTSLLVSGMGGQLKDGDEIGIWTFNNELHTGDFELVKWKESDRNDITRRVLEFVGTRRYENPTRFDQVRPALFAVVAESRRITVILISDGDEVIQGTPFDLQIQKYFLENADELKGKKVPIITVLRGYQGNLISHSISFPPWPVEFPPFPAEPEPKPVKVVEPPNPAVVTNDLSRTLVTTNKGPIVYGEPLIVSGRYRPESGPAPKPMATNPPVLTPASSNPPVVQPPAVESVPMPVPSEPVTNSVTSNSPPASTTPTNPPASVAPTEPSEPPAAAASRGLLIPILLGVVGLAVVGGAWLLLRKPRASGQTSLITKSMDNDRSGRR